MTYSRRHNDRPPLYQRLRDEIGARIAAQQWRAGEAIPTEVDLVREFSASVGTVRKAIEMLVAEGVLERFQGRGTFVRRARFDGSLTHCFQASSGAEVYETLEARLLRREALPAPADAARALGLSPGADAIHLARLRMQQGKPLLAESIWLPRQAYAALLEIEVERFAGPLYPVYEACCGQVIASAEETLGAENADDAHARLLQLNKGAPLIVVERTACGYDGQPLEWRRSRGPADRFRYRVDIR